MVNYIITSSILILLVVLLRQLLKGKIMLRIQYAMWLLVLVRLLIPVQLGSSPLSIMNVVSIIETSANEQVNDDLPANTDSNVIKNESTVINTNSNVNKNDNAVTNTNVNTNKSDEAVINNAEFAVAGSQMSDDSWCQDITENNVTNSSANTNAAMNQPVDVKSLNFDISTVVLCCWIVGAVILGGILLVSNIIFRYRLICTRKRLEISDYPLAVYISNEVPSSCLFGIFKPAVYLTEEAVANDEQRSFVLEHELTHFKHMDHVWSILRNIILVIHWYNTLIWAAAVLSRRDAELACDEATISRLGDSARVEYGKALLELSQIKRRNAYLLSFSAASNKEDLKERINMLVYKPNMKRVTAVVLALILCVITACTFTGKNDNNQADTESQEISNEQFDTEEQGDSNNEQESEETSGNEALEEWEQIAYPSVETVVAPEYYQNWDGDIIKNLYFWTPYFDNAQDLNNEYWGNYIFYSYTSSDYEYVDIHDRAYYKVPEEDVKKEVYDYFGIELTDFYPEQEENGVFYEDGYYYVGVSDFPQTEYAIIDYRTSGKLITVTYGVNGYDYYNKVFNLEKADNDIGFIIKSIEYKEVTASDSISDTARFVRNGYIGQIFADRYNDDTRYGAYILYDVDSNGYPELLVRYSDGWSIYGDDMQNNGNNRFGDIGDVYSCFYANKDGGIIRVDSRGENITVSEIKLENAKVTNFIKPVQREIYSGKALGYTIEGEPLQMNSIYDISPILNYPWQ